MSLTSACKDAAGNDCSLIWDVTKLTSDETALRLEFEVRATGQAGCSVAIQVDHAMIAGAQAAALERAFAGPQTRRAVRVRLWRERAVATTFCETVKASPRRAGT